MICLTPSIWAFPFCFTSDRRKPRFQMAAVSRKPWETTTTALSTPHSSTRDMEQEHWRRQLALSAVTASRSQTPHWHLLALLKIHPWKDTGLTVTTPAGYPGHLLKWLYPRAHMPDHPKGCVYTFAIQTDMQSQNYVHLNCLLCPSNKNAQISSP